MEWGRQAKFKNKLQGQGPGGGGKEGGAQGGTAEGRERSRKGSCSIFQGCQQLGPGWELPALLEEDPPQEPGQIVQDDGMWAGSSPGLSEGKAPHLGAPL